MIGILSYGAYFPFWRVDRAEISAATGRRSLGGQRTVASWDEDALTMGVEAGLDCLTGIDPKSIDGLYFATVSPPFREKQTASMISSALDLRRNIFTADFTSCLRAGTTAVKAAMDAVKSGEAKRIAVIVSDCRKARPKSESEQVFGDGAAAFLIGANELIASIEGFTSVSNAIPGPWQRSEDAFPKSFEPKLDRMHGVLKDVPDAVMTLMKELHLKFSQISKYAFYGNEPRVYRDLSNVLGIDAKTQLQDSLFETVGITGTPHCLLLLISALEAAGPDEKIICASQGEGSDAFLAITTNHLEQEKKKHKGTKYLSLRKSVSSYSQYMDSKGIRETGWPPKDQKASVVKYWRDQKWELPLYGMRCNKCGTLQYPIARVCMICGEKDNHQEVKIARRGKVYTYTHDYLLAPGLYPCDVTNPATRVVADMEDGCRLWLEMTDYELEEVGIDMRVETTFRLIHQKGDYRYYGWRAKPVRT